LKQTPIHDTHNPDLLKLIPKTSKRIIEVGCSSGALAREFKKINSNCYWLGIEIDSQYADLAKRYCDETLVMDIENPIANFWDATNDVDCWIFGDTLEHLRDPWSVLKLIRNSLPSNGSVVACIPNAQHWSIQAKLSIGDFRYQDSGLLDRTHLRWFTRQTIIEMFESCGYKLIEGFPRIFDEPQKDLFLPLIEQMAKAAGSDPKISLSDALPLQFVVRFINR